MAKRVICLMLCAVLLVLSLASCSNDGDSALDTAQNASRYTTTLNVWMITESELMAYASDLVVKGFNPNEKDEKRTEEENAIVHSLTEEQKAAWKQMYEISYQINKITKNDFKTKLNLKLFTEDQYYTELEKAIKKQAEDKANGVNSSVNNNTSDETFLNEYNIPELKYPEVPEHQVDILFLGGFENYDRYITNGWLTALDGLIEEKASVLNDYINGVFFDGAERIVDMTYAIPNNRGIGEFVYLAVNEELMSDYGYVPADFSTSSVFDATCKTFLDYIYNDEELGATPIYSETGKVELNRVHYWSYDLDTGSGAHILAPDEFSIFGTIYSDSNIRGDQLVYSNILTNASYLSQLETKIYYESKKGYITTDPNAEVAVKIVKGGVAEKRALEEAGYCVLVSEAPRATNEEVFKSMFAVSAYSNEASRCVEVISKINTDAELRNLLQYGVEEVNYTLASVVENDVVYQYVVPTEDNLYVMDVEKTGNVFLTYPSSADEIHRWEDEKLLNSSVLTYPTLGFFLDVGTGARLNSNSMRVVQAVSARFGEYVNSISSLEEFAALRTAVLTNGGNSTAFATYLLSVTGDVSCEIEVEQNGATVKQTVTVDAATLAASIDVMMNAEELNPDDKNKTFSPASFYLYWISLIKG